MLRFVAWDLMDVTEFSYASSWVGCGHVWLMHPELVARVFVHPPGWELVRVTKIERAARADRQKSFGAAVVRTQWLLERLEPQ